MLPALLTLLPAGFALSFVLTAIARTLALRFDFVDKPGGRKVHAKVTPLGGGIAIFWSLALPLLAGAFLASKLPIDPALQRGIAEQTPLLLKILAALAAMHVLGLVDDKRALGPYSKLLAQLAITTILVLSTDLRILTALGPIPSAVITVLWIATLTNAFNFLDNMDGLSAGIAAVCAAAFLITTLSIGQYFIAAALALLLGVLLGFLCFNFAPATIFMGDSGSLLLGFLLSVLTVRTTFLPPSPTGEDAGLTLVSRWYTLFAPVMVLAVPLYDLTVVSVIRLAKGKSPFKGDTNHFSHRLVRRGMTKPGAVLCIYLITATTALSACVLPHVHAPLPATLLFLQTLLTLAVILILERGGEGGPNLIVWPEDKPQPPSPPAA